MSPDSCEQRQEVGRLLQQEVLTRSLAPEKMSRSFFFCDAGQIERQDSGQKHISRNPAKL